jgi:hypothetical protein
MPNYIYLVELPDEDERLLVVQDKGFIERIKQEKPGCKVERIGLADFHTQPGYLGNVSLVTRYRPIGVEV